MPTQRVAPGLTPDFQNIEATRSYIEALVTSIIGSGFLQSVERLLIIRGGITMTTPSIDFGAGFSVSKNGVGDVTVTFTTPFSGIPTVVCMPQSGGASNMGVSLTAAQPANRAGGFRVIRFNTNSGATEDGPILFTALGPPAT